MTSPVRPEVTDLLLDLALPRTDAGVAVQWLVMVPVWLAALVVSRSIHPDVRLLVWGVVTVNLAWFLIRMAH